MGMHGVLTFLSVENEKKKKLQFCLGTFSQGDLLPLGIFNLSKTEFYQYFAECMYTTSRVFPLCCWLENFKFSYI